jgi:branched-chain amino acid transport system ATP-binding protein
MGQQKAAEGVKRWTIEEMYAWFPRLAERRRISAGNLSGGEQQMLTICRSLLGNPQVILIDEPTEGLAPRVVETVMDAILAIHKAGVSVLLVEQKLTIALKVSRRVLVMGHGRIVYEGSPQELMERDDVRHDWLEVG